MSTVVSQGLGGALLVTQGYGAAGSPAIVVVVPLPAAAVVASRPQAQPQWVSVDDDTEQAILLLWAAAGDLVPVAVVDDDTEQAVLLLWGADVQLSELFSTPPRTGRQKSTQPGQDVQATGPYAVLDCQLDSRQGASTTGTIISWTDRRKVTLTVYGVRADVVLAAGLLRALLNASTQLVYPSGAKFLMWQPLGDVKVEEDRDSKAGKDVWTARLEAIVWSVRKG